MMFNRIVNIAVTTYPADLQIFTREKAAVPQEKL